MGERESPEDIYAAARLREWRKMIAIALVGIGGGFIWPSNAGLALIVIGLLIWMD